MARRGSQGEPEGARMYLAWWEEEPGKIRPRHLKGHSVKLMVTKLEANPKGKAAGLSAAGLDLAASQAWRRSSSLRLGTGARLQKFSSEA